MTTDKNTNLHLTINSKPIKKVNEFVYLGHKLSATNDGTATVKHRIGQGWAAFEKNKVLLTSKRVPYHIKASVYKTYVLPVVLYGLECVNWTIKLQHKIETFQNHIMRFMTNNRLIDHVKIEELLKITTLTSLMSIIRSKVLNPIHTGLLGGSKNRRGYKVPHPLNYWSTNSYNLKFCPDVFYYIPVPKQVKSAHLLHDIMFNLRFFFIVLIKI